MNDLKICTYQKNNKTIKDGDKSYVTYALYAECYCFLYLSNYIEENFQTDLIKGVYMIFILIFFVYMLFINLSILNNQIS